MYIDAATKVLYRTPVQNLPQPISLQLVCNSRSVQKLLYRSCCTERLYRFIQPVEILYRTSVQNACTDAFVQNSLYRTPVHNFCTAIFSFVIHIVLVIEQWNRHFQNFVKKLRGGIKIRVKSSLNTSNPNTNSVPIPATSSSYPNVYPNVSRIPATSS